MVEIDQDAGTTSDTIVNVHGPWWDSTLADKFAKERNEDPDEENFFVWSEITEPT